jgi:hypothetical protein
MDQKQAIAFLRGLGFRVTMPKPKVVKNRVGPSFVATFADGNVTRMSVYTSLAQLDYERGMRLACIAYQSRTRRNPPPIVSACFEQDGKTLATYGQRQLAA